MKATPLMYFTFLIGIFITVSLNSLYLNGISKQLRKEVVCTVEYELELPPLEPGT